MKTVFSDIRRWVFADSLAVPRRRVQGPQEGMHTLQGRGSVADGPSGQQRYMSNKLRFRTGYKALGQALAGVSQFLKRQNWSFTSDTWSWVYSLPRVWIHFSFLCGKQCMVSPCYGFHYCKIILSQSIETCQLKKDSFRYCYWCLSRPGRRQLLITVKILELHGSIIFLPKNETHFKHDHQFILMTLRWWGFPQSLILKR